MLIGIDLAWHCNKNPSAIAAGYIDNGKLLLDSIEPAVIGIDSILEQISSYSNITGIAIDASLIIHNQIGQRKCEAEVSRDYSSRKAGCHPTNLSLYPNSLSVQLADQLLEKGFQHISGKRWLMECYPHPSLIECFGLPERLLYKKGKVSDKKQGQIELVSLIKRLEHSKVLPLITPQHCQLYLSETYINQLKGQALKTNEDALDAIICLYIAALYQIGATGKLYGDVLSGYIWVPQVKCI